jgi:hypothetical protein
MNADLRDVWSDECCIRCPIHGVRPAPRQSLRYHPALVALHWISALVLLHTLGALYHHRFRKDQLWRRMWFEQRSTINPVRRRTNDTEV